MQGNSVKGFLETVGEQIRWKRARAPLTRELETHILDLRDGFIAEGMDASEAEAHAVAEMGNAEEIGLELDRIHRPRPNWALIVCSAALTLLGLVTLWSVGERETYFMPMLMYSLIGIAALLGGYFLDYTTLAKCPGWVFFAVCGVCMVLPMLGAEFMTVSIQLCYVLPVLFAILVYRSRGGGRNTVMTVLAAYCACFAAAVFSHSWLSLMVYMTAACGGIVLFAARRGWFGRMRWLVTGFALGMPPAVFAVLCVLSRTAVRRRLSAAFFPESDPLGYGWIATCIREIFAGARFIGEGGRSGNLDTFLAPSQINSVEYTLAAAVNKFGLVVFIAVAVLSAAVIALTVRGIRRQSCNFGALMALSVILGFAVRTVGYFAGNLGFILFTFEGLPLFSFCGKLMVLDMLMVGILLSVFRTESIARDSGIKLGRTA